MRKRNDKTSKALNENSFHEVLFVKVGRTVGFLFVIIAGFVLTGCTSQQVRRSSYTKQHKLNEDEKVEQEILAQKERNKKEELKALKLFESNQSIKVGAIAAPQAAPKLGAKSKRKKVATRRIPSFESQPRLAEGALSLQIPKSSPLSVEKPKEPIVQAPKKPEYKAPKEKLSERKLPRLRYRLRIPRDWRFRQIVRNYRNKRWIGARVILGRRGRYERIMRRELKAVGIPQELFMLAGVESNFKPRRTSPAGAVGLWQFMKRTGSHYGLRINHWVDERRDVHKSTKAAARYLKRLYSRYKRWEYAIAAYNCGMSCVNRMIRSCPRMGFWRMRRTKRCRLPRETRGYVARFYALLYLMRYPSARKGPVKMRSPLRFAVVRTKGAISLRRAARAIRMPFKELYRYNAELSTWTTPPGQNYGLKVPRRYARRLFYHIRRRSGPFHYRSVRVSSRRSRSLVRLSRKYRVPVRTLRVLNGVYTSSIPRSRRYVIVPRYRRGGSKRRAYARLERDVRNFSRRNPSSERATWRPKCYLLKKGDSLRRLGRKFKMSARRIRQYNKKLRRFQAGTWIKLHQRVSCPKSRRNRRVSRLSHQRKSHKKASRRSSRRKSSKRRSSQNFYHRYAD